MGKYCGFNSCRAQMTRTNTHELDTGMMNVIIYEIHRLQKMFKYSSTTAGLHPGGEL